MPELSTLFISLSSSKKFQFTYPGTRATYFIALARRSVLIMKNIQYNLNGSNMDGSFTVDDLISFFSPYKILPIAQENKYLGIFSILSWNCMLCVLIRIALSRQF